MPRRKTAIAIPEDLLEAVDDAAQERGESRSAFISRVLRAALRARRDSEVTRKLDAFFASDPSLGASLVRDAEELERIAATSEDEPW